MIKYEYKVFSIELELDYLKKKHGEKVDRSWMFWDMGFKGWDLVSVSGGWAYFKRVLQEPVTEQK